MKSWVNSHLEIPNAEMQLKKLIWKPASEERGLRGDDRAQAADGVLADSIAVPTRI